ncbi:MAG: GxxExxY protein [Acidobacteriales bacterium]|nr:GxxExxY protein [Terriglobales bacterium]
MTTTELNVLSKVIVDSAMKVHSALGPGLLESAYHGCLLHELRSRGLQVESEVVLPVHYHGAKIELGYRLDLLVEGEIILELKSIESLLPIHTAQLISYLRLSGRKLGFLMNFNVLHMKDGIKRIVNGLEE